MCAYKPWMYNSSIYTRERRGSVVVITSAWHAAGRWFDSRTRHVSLLGVKTWLSTGIVYLWWPIENHDSNVTWLPSRNKAFIILLLLLLLYILYYIIIIILLLLLLLLLYYIILLLLLLPRRINSRCSNKKLTSYLCFRTVAILLPSLCACVRLSTLW